jgi:enoyl-CoA hydratase/carnithine racemase
MEGERVVLVEKQGAVAVVTLNRPNRLNAWTPAMRRQLFDAFDQAEKDTRVKVVVLTGAGRAFCAGADLSPQKRQNTWVLDTRSPLHAMDINKPIIW